MLSKKVLTAAMIAEITAAATHAAIAIIATLVIAIIATHAAITAETVLITAEAAKNTTKTIMALLHKQSLVWDTTTAMLSS